MQVIIFLNRISNTYKNDELIDMEFVKAPHEHGKEDRQYEKLKTKQSKLTHHQILKNINYLYLRCI